MRRPLSVVQWLGWRCCCGSWLRLYRTPRSAMVDPECDSLRGRLFPDSVSTLGADRPVCSWLRSRCCVRAAAAPWKLRASTAARC